MPAAALSLNFAEAIVISDTEEGREREEEEKKKRVSHNAGNSDSTHMFGDLDI